MEAAEIARYARHLVLPEVGGPGQVKLGSSSVLVVGAGGIGSPLLLYLAAAGVGRLAVVDDDTVDVSNLQRQILHGTGSLGLLKTASAGARLTDLNSHARLDLLPERLTADRAAGLFPHYDLIVDGSDSGETRRMVADAAAVARKPLISAAVIQFSGQLTTFKPYLGAEHPCFHCLHPVLPSEAGCTTLGVLGPAAGVMGSLAAVEAIKELLEIGDSLSGWLLTYEALAGEFSRFRLKRRRSCTGCGGAA